MKYALWPAYIVAGIFLCIVAVMYSCRPLSPAVKGHSKVEVEAMMNRMAADVNTKGPAAWLAYFENSPGFFMVSDGQMVFQDYHAADSLINHVLVKSILRINLNWNDIRVDSLSNGWAAVGTNFHEDIESVDSSPQSINGYFTATVHLTKQGWKLRNAHWSVVADK